MQLLKNNFLILINEGVLLWVKCGNNRIFFWAGDRGINLFNFFTFNFMKYYEVLFHEVEFRYKISCIC